MPNIEADECISNSSDSVKIVLDTDVDEEYDTEGREAP